jgi:hypothetical protein
MSSARNVDRDAVSHAGRATSSAGVDLLEWEFVGNDSIEREPAMRAKAW